jgi:large subunit ribosomal protein L3
MKYIVGTKVGMVRLFETNGRAIAATIVHCEPNVVLEVKTPEKHGHSAVKIGYNEIKENKKNKPHNGIFKKVGVTTKQFIKTFTNTTNQYNVGDFIKVDTFESGEYVDVQGKTRGRGFTGAIER